MKIFKASILIVGIILMLCIGLFFGYIFPHGKAVQTLNKEYSQIAEEIIAKEKNIKSTEIPSIFKESISSLDSNEKNANKMLVDFKAISSNRNWLRDLWKKPSIKEEHITALLSDISQIKQNVPNSSKYLIKKLLDDSIKKIQQSSSKDVIISEIKAIKSASEIIISSVNSILEENEKDQIIQLVFDPNSSEMTTWADSAIGALKRNRESEKKSLNSKLERTNSVKDVVENARQGLDELNAINGVLKEVVQFNPSRWAANTEHNNIKNDTAYIDRILDLASKIVSTQKKANEKFKTGLIQMDNANRRLSRLEQYAQASVIRSVYSDWNNAVSFLSSASSELSCPSFYKGLNKSIWENCNKKALSNIDNVYQQALAHRNLVEAKYREAARQESTLGGRATRNILRGLDRLRSAVSQGVDQISNSRVGKEIGISVKMLILGTKAFYDLQDPNKDIFTWAMSYEGDVDQLMKEVDEVQRMDQPSITGKNTFIESLVDKAYDKSFKKK